MPSSACDWSSDVCSSDRSEEHTSELQSRSDLVCRLLLEKKKTRAKRHQERTPLPRRREHDCPAAPCTQWGKPVGSRRGGATHPPPRGRSRRLRGSLRRHG